jgi:membrane protein implicated in regulation of membrane protease activity
MFILILIGLCLLSGWVSHAYLTDLILQLAAVALSWGAILLVLYVGFRVLGWDWWAERVSEEQKKRDQLED